MRCFLSLVLLVFLIGCSERAVTPVAGPGTVESPPPAAGEVPPAPAPPHPAAEPPSYPESEQVQALLYRARELRDAGKYREALALADEAVAHDPNSPSATTLRAELWEIITKI